jgi:hypothetical protein
MFVVEPLKCFLCPICLYVLKDPVQCKEGHAFCGDCSSRLRQCACCRINLIPGGLTRNLIARDSIQELEVRCSTIYNSSETCIKTNNCCSWLGKLKDQDKHLQLTCSFVLITCSYRECNAKVRQIDAPSHRFKCGNKLSRCEFCHKVTKRKSLQVHHDVVCEEIFVSCPNKCTEKIQRKNVETHKLTTCSLQQIQCPLFSIGCTCKGWITRNSFDAHVCNANNLVTVIRNLANKNEKLEQDLLQANEKINLNDGLMQSKVLEYDTALEMFKKTQQNNTLDIHNMEFKIAATENNLIQVEKHSLKHGKTLEVLNNKSVQMELKNISMEANLKTNNKNIEHFNVVNKQYEKKFALIDENQKNNSKFFENLNLKNRNFDSKFLSIIENQKNNKKNTAYEEKQIYSQKQEILIEKKKLENDSSTSNNHKNNNINKNNNNNINNMSDNYSNNNNINKNNNNNINNMSDNYSNDNNTNNNNNNNNNNDKINDVNKSENNKNSKNIKNNTIELNNNKIIISYKNAVLKQTTTSN